MLQGVGGATALALAGGGVAGVVSPAKPLPRIGSFAVKATGRVRRFYSQPGLQPPTVTSSAVENAGRADPGYLFLGPGPVALTGSQQFGPLIVDRVGEPVWFRPLPAGLQVTNFASWRYRGQPVMAWWEGQILPSGYGQGEAVVLDRAYREIARVRAANGRSMDLHALTLTPEGTALFTCYPETVPIDLSSIGGARNSQIVGSILQEVDIASGRLVYEWRSLEHIPASDSHEPMAEPYDYLHLNSIQKLPDGNLLISGRHTWAVYKLDRRTGSVIWTLGGKRSQFRLAANAEFAWQHDARMPSERVLTLFDNATNGLAKTEAQSRGVVLEVDESRRAVTLKEAYISPRHPSVDAMGSVQILPSGRVMVGWGVASYTEEFAPSGTPISGFALPAGMYSYRGLWLAWSSVPHHPPEVVARRDGQREAAILYASWNGATEVTGWQVQAGSEHDQLRPLGIAPRHGFETVIPVHSSHRYAAVTALDRAGRPLKRSMVIKL